MWAATSILEQLNDEFSSQAEDRWLQGMNSSNNETLSTTTSTTTTMMDGAITNATTPMESDGSSNDDDSNSDTISLLSVVFSNLFLFFLIFGLSATVDVKHMKEQLTNRFAIGTGVAMQFLFMPVLGFVAVMMLRNNPGMTRPMELLLLVVTSSPGGSYSNWWCSLFNAELALSLAMTSVSSILSIAFLPMNLLLYTWLTYSVFGQSDDDDVNKNVLQSLDFGAIFISLSIVMSAILSGLVAGYVWDNETFHSRINHFGSCCGLFLILISIFLSSGADGADVNIWSLPWAFYVGTAFPCVLGMILANIGSRMLGLTKPECVAISIEVGGIIIYRISSSVSFASFPKPQRSVHSFFSHLPLFVETVFVIIVVVRRFVSFQCCYQNTAIGTSVAVTMFSNPNDRAEAISVPLFYGVCEALLIGVYCVWAWKMGWTKAPPDENICVIMYKSYEVVHQDNNNDNDDIAAVAEGGEGGRELPDGNQDDKKEQEDVEAAQTKHRNKEGDDPDEEEADRFTDQTTSTGTAVTAINVNAVDDEEQKEAAPPMADDSQKKEKKNDNVANDEEEQVLEAASTEVELADYNHKGKNK
jgi:predicted Na+-dependent transporter